MIRVRVRVRDIVKGHTPNPSPSQVDLRGADVPAQVDLTSQVDLRGLKST